MLGTYSRALAALLLLIATTANAKSSVCSPEYETQIRSAFYSGTSVSTAEVDAYIARLEKKKSEIAGLIKGKFEKKADEKGKASIKADKVAEAVKKSKSILALDQAVVAAQSMKSASSFAQVCSAATAVSDLEGAIRFEGDDLPFMEMVKSAKAILASWKIPKQSPASAEASNLVDAQGHILSSSDIEALKARGVDISSLQPAAGSVFYTPVANISSVDMSKAALGSTIPMYAGIGDLFPADNTFVYEGIKKSNTKPKMDVSSESVKDAGFKLKFEAEYNADPMINALMMSMGFAGDLSKFVKHIHVVLPNGTSVDDVKREWEEYFSRDRVRVNGNSKIEQLIESVGKDSQGRTMITFKEGMIEVHPDKIKRLGPWKYSDGDHNSRREVRGMEMIQMWVDNSDLKEFDNQTTAIRKNEDGSYTRVLYNSDVGHSLGGIWLETPSMYPWTMVKSTSGDSIEINFRNMHPVSIRSKITLADARWGARLIAQLTRAQIVQAVSIGGWPACVQQAYVERMISRRNDLLKALGLVGAKNFDGSSIALLSAAQDRKSFDIENVCKWNEVDKADTQKYGFSFGDFMKPLLISVKRQLFGVTRGLVGGHKHLVLNSKDFKWDGTVRPVSEVIVDFEREIERNPNPKSDGDLFIVRDQFDIGVRAGVTVGPYADVTEMVSYQLAYPARSEEEGLMNNGFIFNVLLAKDVRDGKLPDSYVLETEHSFEVGAGIQANIGMSPVAPVVQAGVGHLKAWRSIYDHRDGKKVMLYRDRQDYTDAQLKLFAQLGFLKIPVLEMIKTWGHALGKGVILSEDDMKNPELSAAVDKAVVEGDFSKISNRETDFFSSDEIKTSMRSWKLLVFQLDSEKRLDNVQIKTDDVRNVVQFKTSTGSKLTFFSKVEKNVAVEVYADPTKPANLELQVNVMGVDGKTVAKEMANKYLRFINGLSVDGKPLIALTPELGYAAVDDNWGDTLTQSNSTYSVTAMARILKATPDMFWNALASSMKVSRSAVNAMRSGADRTHAQDLVIDHANQFLKSIAKAKAQDSLEKKISKLAEAFRKAIYQDRMGFYNPTILGALNRIAGADAFYSRNLITIPEPKQTRLPEGAPLFGRVGTPPQDSLKYLIFEPKTGLDIYTMFDSWF